MFDVGKKAREAMTTLGAVVYIGFFAVAALWLFLTSDGSVDQMDSDGHVQDFSKSASTAAAGAVSSPMLVTHSSRK